MRIDVVTLFPEMFEPFLATSITGRAIASGALTVGLKQLREHGLGKHRAVDDTPYGGGSGMVMRVDCIVNALEAIDAALTGDTGAEPPRAHRVLLSPQGARLDQRRVIALAEMPRLALVCGRYEGFDDRVGQFVDEEISLGDFVLAGGEVAAMAIIDAVARLLPGAVGNAASLVSESHSPEMDGLLEYPQFTRPAVFRGLGVPEVLTSGDHGKIAAFRREEARRRTAERRPDLLAAPATPAPAPARACEAPKKAAPAWPGAPAAVTTEAPAWPGAPAAATTEAPAEAPASAETPAAEERS